MNAGAERRKGVNPRPRSLTLDAVDAIARADEPARGAQQRRNASFWVEPANRGPASLREPDMSADRTGAMSLPDIARSPEP